MTRVFSGIQPTGTKHLGNYIGAIRHYVTDQDLGEAFYCIVDLHSISVPYDPAELSENTLDTAATLLAAGLEPSRCTLFIQSDVDAHAVGAWLLGAVATMGELRRMTQFKEKSHGQDSVSIDLFSYPVLQAADILLYRADRVPVGDDQRQHLELARDIAIRFNHRCGDTLVVPETSIPPVGARVMDLQNPTAKMSKSVSSPNGIIDLLEDPARSAKKIRSAVTDTGREILFDVVAKPGVSNLLTIYSSLTGRPIPELVAAYEGRGYGDLKKDLAEVVVEFVRPVQERTRAYLDDPGQLDKLLAIGAEKARAVSSVTLRAVYERVGFLAPASSA